MVLHGLAVTVAGQQQGVFQGQLFLGLVLGPVQQAVGIARVVDAASAIRIEFKTHLRAALANDISHLRLLFRGGAVFLRQVLAHVLAARPHLGVQLKRLKVQRGLDVGLQFVQRLQKSMQAYGTPGARDVGDKVDLERFHGR